ncbi:hypothetical protein [Leptospira gomenensis]|nr:hypothetical protein [Leptospira gomenensis]
MSGLFAYKVGTPYPYGIETRRGSDRFLNAEFPTLNLGASYAAV